MNCISSFGDSATAAVRDNPSSAAWTQLQRKKLITIYIHDGGLCRVCVYLCAINVCVCVLFVYVSVGARQWENRRFVRLRSRQVNSAWSFSQMGGGGRSRYSHHRMQRLLFLLPEYTWAARLIFPLLFSARKKKTKMLNTDMYITFKRTRANSPSKGSVER